MTSQIILIVVLVLLSAFFSSSETAFSSVNKIRLKNYAEQGSSGAKRALKIANNYDKALTAILIGNNIVNIASSSLATVLFTQAFGADSVVVATLVMTVVVLIFGEILPKSMAKENADSYSITIAPILSLIMLVLTPFTAFFAWLKNSFVKLVGNKNNEPSVTEEELKYIIDEIEDEGVLEEQESNLVRSALEFDETTISEILIPRVNICAVSISQNCEEIKDIFLSERYSRLPVYEKTMDNIIGTIHYKEFVAMYLKGDVDIRKIIHEPLIISEHKKISEVLKIMQGNKSHIAIVIDQYGGTEGMVTLEDILEELVGEIYDENDDEMPSFLKIDDNRYVVSGELSIADMLENLDLPEDMIETECNSVGGFVMELLGHIPSNGETVKFGVFEFRAGAVNER